MSVEAAEAYCLRQGEALDTAKRLVAEARQRITVAADYARDEQLGKARLICGGPAGESPGRLADGHDRGRKLLTVRRPA